jgi:effector-binding domain-containing protein
MKTFGKILLWIIGIIALLVLISFLLPKTYKVERSTYIHSNSGIIYNLTCNLNKWSLWTPWNKELDSTVQFELVGPDCQVGTIRKWSGEIVKTGEMVITELVPGALVAYDLSLDEGSYKSTGKIEISVEQDSCKVTWNDEGDLGYNPLARYMGLFMDNMMGKDFEKGLAKLKSIAEMRAGWPVIEEKTMDEQIVLLIRDSAGPETYGNVLGKAYGEIMAFVKGNKLKCSGHPFAIYLTWDSVTMFSTMDIGTGVEKAEKGKGRIRVEKIPVQKVVLARYFGPYDKTANTYYILDQYIKESCYQQAGGPWEIYVTDPLTEKDTMKWETHILFPVK